MATGPLFYLLHFCTYSSFIANNHYSKSISTYMHLSLYINQCLLLYFCFCVCWFGFCFCILFITKRKKDLRPDLEARIDNGKPTTFTTRALNRGNLWGQCILTTVPQWTYRGEMKKRDFCCCGGGFCITSYCKFTRLSRIEKSHKV